jgi:hypothetical protein
MSEDPKNWQEAYEDMVPGFQPGPAMQAEQYIDELIEERDAAQETAREAEMALHTVEAHIQELIQAEIGERPASSNAFWKILPRPEWSQELAMLGHALDLLHENNQKYRFALRDIYAGASIVPKEDGQEGHDTIVLNRELMQHRAEAALEAPKEYVFDSGPTWHVR